MMRERSQQFAKAGANQGAEHQIAGFILTSANGGD